MKIKILFLLLSTCIFGIAGFGQSVVITGKKVTYKRPKPIADFKKTFTVNYPKVKASTPALSKKIETAISYESIFEMSIKEELNDIQWLENADFTVGFNKNGVLSIALSIEGSGAYPSGSTKHIVVDLKTGSRTKPSDAFSNLAGLLVMANKAKDVEVAEAIIEVKKDPEYGDADIESMFKSSEEYNKVTLDEFSIRDNGVTFHHNYGFAHVAQAMEPPGEFFFTWDELKPFIKAGSLLSRIAR